MQISEHLKFSTLIHNLIFISRRKKELRTADQQLIKLRIKGILFYIIMLCEKVGKGDKTLKYQHFLCVKKVEKGWKGGEYYEHIPQRRVMHFFST